MFKTTVTHKKCRIAGYVEVENELINFDFKIDKIIFHNINAYHKTFFERTVETTVDTETSMNVKYKIKIRKA